MSEWINKMRQKSDGTKNKLAIIFAVAFTLLIVGIWILVLANRKQDETVKAKSTSEELKPLFMIFKNAKDGLGDVRENIKTYKANVKDITAEKEEANQ